MVTGTDTGAGKTAVACALLAAARARGLRACGFKPVASGCEATPAGLRNADALALQAASGSAEDYASINPCALRPAIAPHLAARDAGTPIRREVLDAAHAALAARHELVVLEGAGGWLVPFGEDWSFGDWVGGHGWPVLVVVGLRLGCLNHALLTAEAVSRRTRLAGWAASVVPPAMDRWQDNLEALAARMPAPCWGVLPPAGTMLQGGALDGALAALLDP